MVLPWPKSAVRVWSVLACVLCALNVVFVHAAGLEIGWAERDITPSLDGGKKIPLAGQYYVRDATNIHSRLKVTCCVMRNGDDWGTWLEQGINGFSAAPTTTPRLSCVRATRRR